MRTKNSIKNISISLISQIIFILFGFVSRKIFLDTLGSEYLGVNGLLTNVLSMLGLAEMGVGTSIVYNLYKPLAEKNKDKIIALVQLYKKLYSWLALIVFFLSLILYPFLGKIMKGDQNVNNITIIYFIFVARNIFSYLYAYKWSLIHADQKGYVLGKINLFFQVLLMIIKIAILIIYKNYILFLTIDLIIMIIQNIYNSRIVDKYYPYIKTKENYSIDNDIRKNIITNVKALFLHNIGTYCVFGTDNLLISSFINVATVGLYSNYTMLISQLSGFIAPIFGGISASIGNMIASEDEDKNYFIFKIIYMINFITYSTATIFLYNLIEPFINWWLGNGYLLDNLTLRIILLNFYITGLRTAINTFKEKAGIFKEDRYMPLIESIINLGSSIILVKYLGLAGIFIGTTISTLLVVFWTEPYLVYKNIFKKPLKKYYIKYFRYIFFTLISGYITTTCINKLFDGKTILSLIGMGIFSILFPVGIYSLLFYKSEEFKYLFNMKRMFILKKNQSENMEV